MADADRASLSARATEFVRRQGAVLSLDLRPGARRTDTDSVAIGAGDDLVARARQYASEYGGLRFVVPGGVLVGQLWLAARRPGVFVQAASDGTYMFLAADHSDAQCAFILTIVRVPAMEAAFLRCDEVVLQSFFGQELFTEQFDCSCFSFDDLYYETAT